MEFLTFYKLFRFKPTIAWSACGFLLGVAVAINQFGWNLNWYLVWLVLLATILIQGFLAHAINDLTDEEVDKKTDMKGTNRAKVLLIGLATRTDLTAIVIISLAVTFGVAIKLYHDLGWLIFVFYAIGIYAPLAYSMPPLKLGWRPYSEWTVVLPALTALVVGTSFVASGELSWLSLAVGTIYSLFNIIWFIISRMVDYYPDKEAGKITSIVKYGLSSDGVNPYLDAIFMGSMLVSVFFMYFISNFFYISIIFCIVMSFYIPRGYKAPVELSTVYRTMFIFFSIVHSIILAAALIYF